jgi:hypothetical protein
MKQLLDTMNIVFTVIFSIELAINLFSYSFREFISSRWSVFDFCVVILSLVSLGPLDMPVNILRALRVVRLFGRLKAVKKILEALSASIVPMLNAFFIMLIVAMICKKLACISHSSRLSVIF